MRVASISRARKDGRSAPQAMSTILPGGKLKTKKGRDGGDLGWNGFFFCFFYKFGFYLLNIINLDMLIQILLSGFLLLLT